MSKPNAGGKLPPESCEKVVLHTKFGQHPELKTIVNFFVNGSRLDAKLKAQYDSAASAVHDWAYGLEKEWLGKGKTLPEIADICAAMIEDEKLSASLTYNLDDEAKAKAAFKKFDQAHRKVIGCLRNGGSLSEYTTCTACANFNTDKAEEAVATQQRQQAVSSLANARNISEEEAAKELDKQPALVSSNPASTIAANDTPLSDTQKQLLELGAALDRCSAKDKETVDKALKRFHTVVDNICDELFNESIDSLLHQLQDIAS